MCATALPYHRQAYRIDRMKFNDLQLSDVRFFAAAAEKGSLATAAMSLNVPKASASRQLQRLEAALGRSLLHRGAGRFALTDEGRTFLPLAHRMLSTMEEVVVELRSQSGPLKGSLRIAAPYKFGRTQIAPCIAPFLVINPEVDITLDLDSRRVDLLADEADLAIRIGDVGEDSLVARLIATEKLVLCASPGYLTANGRPMRVEELSNHRLLMMGSGNHIKELTLPLQGRKQTFIGNIALRSNEPSVLAEAARYNAGIAFIPVGYVSYELHSGALVEVLPDLELLPASISAVYAPGRRQSRKVRAFLDFLVNHLKQSPANNSAIERRRKVFGVERFSAKYF